LFLIFSWKRANTTKHYNSSIGLSTIKPQRDIPVLDI